MDNLDFFSLFLLLRFLFVVWRFDLEEAVISDIYWLLLSPFEVVDRRILLADQRLPEWNLEPVVPLKGDILVT